MTRSASVVIHGSEFDAFLFAPIGEDRNDMLLSVLSALARLDVDPWEEAANLAKLPEKTAAQRLASLIATLPDRPSTSLNAGAIAARLIPLLPRPASFDIASRKTLLGTDTATNSWAVAYVIFMAFALSAQWIAASRQPLAQLDDAPVPAATAVSPEMPAPNSGR